MCRGLGNLVLRRLGMRDVRVFCSLPELQHGALSCRNPDVVVRPPDPVQYMKYTFITGSSVGEELSASINSVKGKG
jgi:hypothetical protein